MQAPDEAMPAHTDGGSTEDEVVKDKHFTSRMLICAGALMGVSGMLIAICAKLIYGGILFAAAACMFFAARNFRIAEDQNENENRERSKENEN